MGLFEICENTVKCHRIGRFRQNFPQPLAWLFRLLEFCFHWMKWGSVWSKKTGIFMREKERETHLNSSTLVVLLIRLHSKSWLASFTWKCNCFWPPLPKKPMTFETWNGYKNLLLLRNWSSSFGFTICPVSPFTGWWCIGGMWIVCCMKVTCVESPCRDKNECEQVMHTLHPLTNSSPPSPSRPPVRPLLRVAGPTCCCRRHLQCPSIAISSRFSSFSYETNAKRVLFFRRLKFYHDLSFFFLAAQLAFKMKV